MKREILYETKWLQLLRLTDPGNGIHGYDCTHLKWSNGTGIAVLPYRRAQPHAPIIGGEYSEYLLRWEVTPCWGPDPLCSSITGGMDKDGESHLLCAMRELHEEGGYDCQDESRWKNLGTCRPSKASTTTMHLFAVDLTDCKRTEAFGDGSELEDRAHCEWHRDLGVAVDSLVGLMFFRLNSRSLFPGQEA